MAVAVVMVLNAVRGRYEVCKTRRGQKPFMLTRFVGGGVSDNALELSLQDLQCEDPSDMYI